MGALIVFSIDVGRTATFYERVLEVRPTLEASGDIRLRSARDELLIHSIPKRIAKDIVIGTPPVPREESAFKPAFDVDVLEVSLAAVTANGGALTGRSFKFEGMTRHDVVDPEGNVFQLRSRNT